MGRPKKIVDEVVIEEVDEFVEEVVEVAVKSELETQLERQAELLGLREAMTNEGVDSISKLDALLGQVNQRVKELS